MANYGASAGIKRSRKSPAAGRRIVGSVAVALLVGAASVHAQCVGDCDQGGAVTVDEIVTGVNIALGVRNIDDCRQFDANGDGGVTVDELIQGMNAALSGCTPAATTPTPRPTATATVVAANGPEITYFGLAAASGTEMPEAGRSDHGIPIFQSLARIGFGFLIVVEAKPGRGGIDIGTVSVRSDPFSPSLRPDLQIQADRDLGNGSAAICDVRGPPPSEEPGGGVPAIVPPSYDPTSQTIADALNDFGCRFTFRLSNEPCTISAAGNPRFLRTDSTGQFCTDQVVGAYWKFPAGDTLLTVRWTDTRGNPSAERRAIVRVQ